MLKNDSTAETVSRNGGSAPNGMSIRTWRILVKYTRIYEFKSFVFTCKAFFLFSVWIFLFLCYLLLIVETHRKKHENNTIPNFINTSHLRRASLKVVTLCSGTRLTPLPLTIRSLFVAEWVWRLTVSFISYLLLLDGGADGPHGGSRRHPACQPLQGEDVHVWRGLWLLGQPGVSAFRSNESVFFRELWAWPSHFLYRRKFTERQLKGWLRDWFQATMPPCLPMDPQVGVCLCVCVKKT